MISALITIVVLISISSIFLAKRKRLKLLQTVQNTDLKKEFVVYNKLLDEYVSGDMLERQLAHIEKMQKLDIHERAQKQILDLQNYRMVNSLETFNLCLELIRNNPFLADMLKEVNEDEGAVILKNTTGLDDVQFKNNLPMLKQAVAMVKSDKLLPKAV